MSARVKGYVAVMAAALSTGMLAAAAPASADAVDPTRPRRVTCRVTSTIFVTIEPTYVYTCTDGNVYYSTVNL